jgi:predicted DNA binding CopG/RHH family protein
MQELFSGLDMDSYKIYKVGMRNHNKAVLLRVSDSDFNFLKACAYERSMSVQDYLRDLLRYGTLPIRELGQPVKKGLKTH